MVWMSVGLGGGIGFVYALASYANARMAVRCRAQVRFMAVFLGGMALRVGTALALVVFVLLRVPIHLPAFIATFVAVFLAGLVAEVAKIHHEAAVRRGDE